MGAAPEEPEQKISIHALREEGDQRKTSNAARSHNFYPRPPRGGRPGWRCTVGIDYAISIHALREEGDAFCW